MADVTEFERGKLAGRAEAADVLRMAARAIREGAATLPNAPMITDRLRWVEERTAEMIENWAKHLS